MSKLDKEDLHKLHNFITSLMHDVYLPELKRMAREEAAAIAHRMVYDEIQGELRSAIREAVRTHVYVEAKVSLKEGK